MTERAERPHRERVKRWLAGRGSTPWLVALGIALVAPSLRIGLMADDYLHALVLRHLPVLVAQRGPFDLFRFADGDPRIGQAMMDRGQLVWTSDPTGRFAFFRPVSAATHVLDYALWADSPWLMHAQTLAWYALAIVAAGGVFRRFLGETWVAGFALLLFAVDHTHAPAVGWIASRNSVIALALGLPVLTLHDRWRRDGWKPGAWVAPLLLAVALFAGESALAIVAYLVAYAIHVEQGSWRTRGMALAPYLPVLLVWRATYAVLGYGVAGSGMYLDPARSPLAYLAALPHRLPFLLLGEVALPPSDLAVFYEYMGAHTAAWMLGFAFVVLGLLIAAMVPVWRKDPVARFFGTGLLLAALPVCAAFPSDRLLLFVGVGSAGLIAQRVALPGGVGARATYLFLVIVHLVISPPLLLIGSLRSDYNFAIDSADASIPKDPDVTSKTVILLNPPNESFGVYVPAVRAVRGEPCPERIRMLANVSTEVTVTRVDAFSLRVRPTNGFLEHEAERILRASDRPLLAGAVVHLAGMTATVTELTPDGRPAEALFRFDVRLEDPSLVWMRWAKTGYTPWEPPPVGATVTLPAYDFRQFVLDFEAKMKS